MLDTRAWVATRKGLLELSRQGNDWGIVRVHFLGEPVSMVLPPRDGAPLIAALNLGHFGVKCHASDDGGDSWREIPAPVYPPQPENSDGDVPWKLVQIWSMAAADGVLWAGTLPGGLFRSDDRGESWRLVESLWNRPERRNWFGGGYDVPGIHSICIDPADPGRIVLGVSCGGAWYSGDGGEQWALRAKGMRAAYMPPEQSEEEAVQDPHAIAQCDAHPDVLWCQHHNGIWRSVDRGAYWQGIEAPVSTFGFAVAAHPVDPDTAWFVPARADQQRIPVDGALCVTRTRDGGKSFDVLRAGLPQRDCFDLMYRHAFAIAADGETLMMGSTTGNLWASPDGGDSWREVGGHLPPIFAVRFG